MSTLLESTSSAQLHDKPTKAVQRQHQPPTSKLSAKPLNENKPKPTQLWGSNNTAGWQSYVPAAFVPYIQLTRLYSPAPIMLVFFPHLFGLLYAAAALATPFPLLLKSVAILFGGSFFFSNAIHVWDDVVDAPIDALIERTRHRPIPRGAITKPGACVFMLAQAMCALAFFAAFPGGWQKAIWTLPSIVGTAYYPYAKRQTRLPQLVLGLFLSWGVVIGGLMLGVDPVKVESSTWVINVPLSAMVFGCTLWTMMYDTVYAHLDLQDDIRLGVGSAAVLFQEYTKSFLWTALALMTASFATAGVAAGFGLGFFSLAVGGSFLSLASMVVNVDLKKPESIGWWFGTGFWYTAGAIGGGMGLQYLAVLGLF